MLLEFAKKKLCVMTTLFQRRSTKKWKKHHQTERQKINFIKEEQKWKSSVKESRSLFRADIISDHQVVLCKVHVKLTRTAKDQNRHGRINRTQLRFFVHTKK